MRHASTRLVPDVQRGDGWEAIGRAIFNISLVLIYDALVALLNRWYGWFAYGIYYAYSSYTGGMNFRLSSWLVIMLIAFLMFKYRKSDHMILLPYKRIGEMFFGANEATLARKAHKKYRKSSKFKHDEISIAENALKTLIGLNIYNVVDQHTGKANLAGYELEVIEVPTVVVAVDVDSLGFSTLEMTIVAPSNLVMKLDSTTDALRDVFARYFKRSISLQNSVHDQGKFMLTFSDDERETGFNFAQKKEVTPANATSTNSKSSDLSVNQYNTFNELAQSVNDWEVPIMSGVTWNMSKAQHLIIAGKSGSGKTYFVNYLIMQMALHNVSLYLCDPKHSDLSSFDQFVGSSRVATSADDIVNLAQHVVEVMNSRYDLMAKKRAESNQFQVDFTAYGLKPVVLVIDEMASLMSEFKTPKEAKAFQALITQITMKGRQAGVEFISIMQQANATNIDTQARDQFGFRVLLGNSGSTERQMMFGTQEEYPEVPIGTGQGLFVMDGLTTAPQLLHTPRLYEADNALYKTLKLIFKNYNPDE